MTGGRLTFRPAMTSRKMGMCHKKKIPKNIYEVAIRLYCVEDEGMTKKRLRFRWEERGGVRFRREGLFCQEDGGLAIHAAMMVYVSADQEVKFIVRIAGCSGSSSRDVLQSLRNELGRELARLDNSCKISARSGVGVMRSCIVVLNMLMGCVIEVESR